MNRRESLKYALAAGMGVFGVKGLSLAAKAGEMISLPIGNGERPLVAYPGKRPLIRQTTRPPQLETPFSVFDEGIITPNDAFFVRYHLADIPADDRSRRFPPDRSRQGRSPVVAVSSRAENRL